MFQLLQPLSLEVRYENRVAYYPSLVMDFTEGSELVVGAPSEGGYEVRIPPGTRISVQLPQADGIRSFDAEVRRRAERPSPSLHLTWPEKIERIQRRNYVRVDVMVRVVVTPEDRPNRPLSGSTTNLSAGGARIVLPELLTAGTVLTVHLHLPDAGVRECTARVIRSGETEGARAALAYWSAVEFVKITENVRKDITKYVFDIQREQLRRGLE
jgi:c-di-GMP-binding flagellar brake protein YcgR